jgi:hypothetical protein
MVLSFRRASKLVNLKETPTGHAGPGAGSGPLGHVGDHSTRMRGARMPFADGGHARPKHPHGGPEPTDICELRLVTRRILIESFL